MDKKEFHVSRNLTWKDTFEVYGRIKYIGTTYILACSSYPSTPGEASEPFLHLEREEAQQLMDELWNAGMRPVGAAGSAGQLDAVKYHLEDMRKLVFK